MTDMPLRVDLKVEPLDATAFAPFGDVLEVRPTPSFDWPTKALHRFAWDTDERTILQILVFKPQPLTVTKAEFHSCVTEARMHIAGPPAVMVVGAPSSSPPAPGNLRAFRFDGQGVMLKKGTWHGVDAYPLGDEASQFLFLSDAGTQGEIFDRPTDTPKRSVYHNYESAGFDIRLIA